MEEAQEPMAAITESASSTEKAPEETETEAPRRVRSAFERVLLSKRQAHLRAQEDAVASLPDRHIWSAMDPGHGNTMHPSGKALHIVPLRSGLSTDIVQVAVEPVLREQPAILVKDLKAAVAQQVCGNDLVFDLLYDSAAEPLAVGTDSHGAQVGLTKLADMEKLVLHGSQRFDSEAAVFQEGFLPNLTLLWHGEPKFFKTHDNGGRPFRVGVTRNRVTVHANYNPADTEHGAYPEGEAPLVAEFESCAKVFVGVSSGSSWCDHDVDWNGRFGNSILACLEGGRSEVIIGLNPPNVKMNYRTMQLESAEKFHVERLLEDLCSEMPCEEQKRGRFNRPGYVFVGSCIYAFTAPDGDEILEYYSKVGRSDVPYPVAVGRKYIYFMLDQVCVPRAAINEEAWLHDPLHVELGVEGSRWEDAYRWLYDFGKKEELIRFPNYVELAERM
mmetsp:Transcript_28772/g.82359  ORF Transcript_28772/g.82359 Transcript_28772/m.82359 type:complete len:444 (-) Transcript_28772:22-1353(-)